MKHTTDESVKGERRTEKAHSTTKKSSYRKPSNKFEDSPTVAVENKETKRSHDHKKPFANSSKDIRELINKQIDDFFEANKEAGLRKLVSVSKLMDADAQIGMQTKFWNPKMKAYIRKNKPRFGKTNFDLLRTMIFMNHAYNFLFEIVKGGGSVLLVGTRGDIVKEHIKEEAKRVKCFYINQRWLGGTLTNFKTINNSINKLNNLMALKLSDEIKKYSKKEQVMIEKDIERMGKFLGGIRTMRGLPKVLVITDPIHEKNALMEARKLSIPVIAFANTNANPDLIDFIIPCNSSSQRTVWLMTSIMCDAIAEALGEGLKVVGKDDDQIVLPEVAKKEPTQGFIQHKRFTKGSFSRNKV